MSPGNIPFSLRLVHDIRGFVFLQILFIGLAVGTLSYLSFSSQLGMARKLIENQLNTNVVKMLDYGELLYIQPVLASAVKSGDDKFKIYVSLRKNSNSEMIAFSGDASVLQDYLKVQVSKVHQAPVFGEVLMEISIGYAYELAKGLGLLVGILLVCILISVTIFWRIKKRVSDQSLSVDELELVMDQMEQGRGTADHLFKAKNLILQYAENRSRTLALESVSNLAQQVAHDIRSPLLALRVVVNSLKEASEEKRFLIQNAAQRINDIANGLLQKARDYRTEPEDVHLVTVIQNILAEKRLEFREKTQVSISFEDHFGDHFGNQLEEQTEFDPATLSLFVRAIGSELGRIISNLVNNAVEALPENQGQVRVKLIAEGDTCVIEIQDNGKGIDPENLKQLGTRVFSHGKFGMNAGHGLGVFHAAETVRAWAGRFRIFSEMNQGTRVELRLPRIACPAWFTAEISIPKSAALVVVDDDPSFHEIWKRRIGSGPQAQSLKSIYSAREFMELKIDTEMVFIVDFEFKNEQLTGLDLILKKSIVPCAILMTNRSEDPQLRVSCEKLGIKMIPKLLAESVPLKFVAAKSSNGK